MDIAIDSRHKWTTKQLFIGCISNKTINGYEIVDSRTVDIFLWSGKLCCFLLNILDLLGAFCIGHRMDACQRKKAEYSDCQ